jgi:UDP-glucose 4-epimerase
MPDSPGRPGPVAVLGASGFGGSAVTRELRARGVQVRPIRAPRVQWAAALGGVDRVPPDLHRDVVDALAQQLDGARVVVNAAGLPDGNAPAGPGLYGANALLPVLVGRACALAGVERFIHASSAVVQGRGCLDETPRTAPFSPYSRSKALAESLLLREGAVGQVLFRKPWVHDVGRANTLSLVRLARSRASCVAGDGSAPTPQVLIGDVAAVVAYLALVRGPLPAIVLQPPSGMTTGMLLRLLGGHEPRHIPYAAARFVAGGAWIGAGLSRRANAYARRIEMVLFGKRQEPGWLADQGAVPPFRAESWQRLGAWASTASPATARTSA